MRKIPQQIVATCEGWEAVFFSYDDGELFSEPIVCWAFVSERPYVENGEDEERYIEGQVLIDKGTDIGGVNDLPDNIRFVGYLNTALPEGKTKERMDYFKEEGKQLMEIRKSSRLPGKKIRGTKRGTRR